MGKPLIHQAVQIPCLMGAVEIAKANVDDPRRQVGAVIGGGAHAIGQRGHGIEGQVHQLIHWPPSTLYVCDTI